MRLLKKYLILEDMMMIHVVLYGYSNQNYIGWGYLPESSPLNTKKDMGR
jgi:hypothetical protein